VKTLQLYLYDLKELLQGRDFVSARTVLKEVNPVDLAEGWELFSPDERRAIFRIASRQKAVQLFEELDPPQQVALVESLQKDAQQELLEELDPAEATRMMRALPPDMIKHLLSIMKKSEQQTLKQLLQYPPQSVGALMRSRYVTVDAKQTSKSALERVQLCTRLRRIEETHLDTLMVTDSHHHLAGVLPLKILVVAPRDMIVRDLMEEDPKTLPPEADQEEAVKLFTKYKLKSIPVVSPDRSILGVVVYRDIFEVASQEVEEDFAKMAGAEMPAANLTPWQTARRRLPWLVITCVGGLGVSAIIRGFEDTLAEVIALATFSPLIAGMGGNVGSQTATVVVRGLATGEIKKGQEARTVLREFTSGAMLGSVYAAVLAMAAFALYGGRYGWRFSAVVGAAMFISMCTAATMAALNPFLLRRAGADPATAAGPLITTTTDLLSNLVYFGLATWLLLGR
jgi:magnesium transporter